MTSHREKRGLEKTTIDASSSREEPALRLLALDGGGTRGLSELVIIKEVMRRLLIEENEKRIEEGNEPLNDLPKPCDYFDIIGGSGTGGLIALMLGRLRMDVDTAIDYYVQISKDVFPQAMGYKWSGLSRPHKLEALVRLMVEEELGDPESPLLQPGDTPSCRTFVCAQKEDAKNIPVLLRTYNSHERAIECSIWEAARATCAVPTIFEPIEIGHKQPFISGGVGTNNPASALLEEAKALFPSRTIACLLNIGALQAESVVVPVSVKTTIPTDSLNTVERIVNDCAKTHREMHMRFAADPNTYFRLGLYHGSILESENLIKVESYAARYFRGPVIKVLLTLVRKIMVPEGTFSLKQLGSLEHHAPRFSAPKEMSRDIASLVSRLRAILEDKAQYKQLLRCRDSRAQKLLDLFQELLDTADLEQALRRNFVVAMQRLSQASGLSPKCYDLKDVQYTGQPRAVGSFADICHGHFRDRPVCVKVIRPYLYQNENLKETTTKEAILWAQLMHVNVCPMYGLFYRGDMISFVLPWMDKGDLNTYLQHDPQADRLLLVYDVAQGLTYLHQNGVIHGDIKGSNILVSASGRARIADFGIATVWDDHILAWKSNPPMKSVGGSTRWQAPELFDFDSEETVANSKAGDIWAWSCVCYEAFTGNIPFTELRHDATVMLQVTHGNTPQRPPYSSISWTMWGLTESVWFIMSECWKTDPSSRPTAHQVVEYLTPKLDEDTRPTDDIDTFSPVQFRKEMGLYSDIVSLDALEELLGGSSTHPSRPKGSPGPDPAQVVIKETSIQSDSKHLPKTLSTPHKQGQQQEADPLGSPDLAKAKTRVLPPTESKTETRSSLAFALPFKSWDIDERVSAYDPPPGTTGLSLSIPFAEVEVKSDMAWDFQQIQDAISRIVVRTDAHTASKIDDAKLKTCVALESLIGGEIHPKLKEELRHVTSETTRLYFLSEWARIASLSPSRPEDSLISRGDEITSKLLFFLGFFAKVLADSEFEGARPILTNCMSQLADLANIYIDYLVEYDNSLDKGTIEKTLIQVDKALENARRNGANLAYRAYDISSPSG